MATPSQEPEPGAPVWHVLDHGKKVGPLGEAEIAAMISARKIRPKDMAWKRGMQEWLPCSSIPELARLFPPRMGPKISNPIPILVPMFRSTLTKIHEHLSAASRAIRRIKPRQLAVFCLLVIAAAGFWGWWHFIRMPPYDDLVAVFAEASDESRPIIKVEKHGEGYLLSQRSSNRWGDAVPVHKMSPEELTQVFGRDLKEVAPMGLVTGNGNAAIVKVKKGWTGNNITCTTGYLLVLESGAKQLSKTVERTIALPMLARGATEPTSTTAKATVAPRMQVDSKADVSRGSSESTPLKPLIDQSGTSETSTNPSTGLAPSTGTLVITLPSAIEVTTATAASANSGRPVSVQIPVQSPAATSAPVPRPASKQIPRATPYPTPAPSPNGKQQELGQIRQQAETAKARLNQIASPNQKAVLAIWIQNGDEKMKNSKMFESDGRLDAAIIWAKQSQQAFEDGAKALQMYK